MPTKNILFKNSDRIKCIKKHVFDKTFFTKSFTKSILNQKILSSTHLSCDSREIKNGSTFIAIKGKNQDGHDFIRELKNVDCVIFADKHFQSKQQIKNIDNIIWLRDTQFFANEYASIFFDHPSKEMKIIGITGTNGKTTCAYYLAFFYQQLGLKTGLIGTIAIAYGNKILPSINTTPEPILLQRTLREMRKAGVKVVIMEMSSHALALNRVDHIQLDSALLTNVTQDHLDFHLDMQSYLKAKLLIFNLLLNSSKSNKQIVLWKDTNYSKEILNHIDSLSIPFSTYSFNSFNKKQKESNENSFLELTASIKKIGLSGVHCEILLRQKGNSFLPLIRTLIKKTLPLVGEYNLLNLMGCLGELIASGYYVKYTRDHDYNDLADFIATSLLKIKVPGRLEKIENNKGALIIVDYAHTSDALKNVIHSLKKLPHKRIVTLFGCGGDRDSQKRSLMGSVVGQISDFVYITSDNPRTEEPSKIIKMIVDGIKPVNRNYKVIENREEAIKQAVQSLGEDEILLVAGKGHEDYQIIGNEKKHFDDREMIKKYL